jgi:sugar phosphate isomerase/epimerase
MSEKKIIDNLSLSIYSFGYSAGFIQDPRINRAQVQKMDLSSIANLAQEMKVGGVEIPVDKYFPNPKEDGLEKYIETLKAKGLRLIMDLENFSASYLEKLTPFLSTLDVPFVRAKVSTFYGGNRYKNSVFTSDKAAFINNLKESCSLLDEFKFKILIENHQDVVVADLLEIIETYGPQRVGVNWDIGNSFPSGETPNSFISKMGPYIGNVHLKDYRLFWCEEGYLMSRCSLGDGVIDFEYVLNALSGLGNIPLTIELGALNSRVADINNPLYWDYMDGIGEVDKNMFMDYIEKHVLKQNNWKSAWESEYPPHDIVTIENLEMEKSVIYIRNLLNKLN